ncbi:MAG TPA: methylated-DNA--[protein]-cysteine S-methyltransferase [Polyangiaceae bacterium]|nr:methylated-DNA--[protein]-cysteine S-methyltransferase [Polyangiaceae bacterium]
MPDPAGALPFGAMKSAAYSLFQTPIGACGIAWTANGVSVLQLPEARSSATRARVLARSPGALASDLRGEMREVVEAVRALLEGERRDLSGIELDYEGVPEFHRRVYVAARRVLPGDVVTYGELARRMHAFGAARAVGQALGRNPFAIIVPCHRVLASGGKVGGFSANGGASTKLRLLAIEGALGAVRGAGARGPAQQSLYEPRGTSR